MVVESVEPRFARWIVGAEATVVGFPRNVEYEYIACLRCYLPKGHALARADNPQAEATYWTYRTYLDWDYGQSPYDGAGGVQGGLFGPSSHHLNVVNHLFADGVVRAIPRNIDVTEYMYWILLDKPWQLPGGLSEIGL